MLPTSINFKEQMTETRRTQILLGAAQVFAEKGFHKATTKKIAKAAGISEGTIYNYFDNKRELLVAMIEFISMQSLKNILGGELPQDPHELFTLILRDRQQLIQGYGYLLAPVVAEIFADTELREELYQKVVIPISSHLEKYIQTQIDVGQFRQLDPVIATRTIMGAMLLNFALKLTNLDSRYGYFSDDTIVEQLVMIFLKGMMK